MTTQVKESSGPHSDACRHVTVVPVRTGVAVSTSNSLCVLHAPSAYVCIHVCACCPAVCVHVCVRRGSWIFYFFIYFCSWITRLPWWLGRATSTGKEESEGEPDCNIKKPWITVTVLHCWRLLCVCEWRARRRDVTFRQQQKLQSKTAQLIWVGLLHPQSHQRQCWKTEPQ